jgi:glycine cleavage system H lipoate-binding protein
MKYVPSKPKNISEMKPNNVISRVLGLLFLASATIHASPDGGQTPSKNAMRVVSDPELAVTAASLVNCYNQSGQYEPVILEMIDEAAMAEQMRVEGTIGLVTSHSESLQELPDLWRMTVGREVVIPVMNERNPQREEITQLGISPGRLSDMASFPRGIFMNPGAGVEMLVSDFLELGNKGLQGTEVAGTAAFLEALEANPGAIGFTRLTDVMDMQSLQLSPGLCLVPLDLDGNGELSHREDICRSASDLVHAIYLGKYPRSLIAKIYAVAEHKPVKENQLAFLDWMAQEGQGVLASAGIMGLVTGERQSAIQHLHEHQPLVSGVPAPVPATRAILLICGFLLVLFAVVIVVIQRLSIAPSEPLAGNGEHPPFGQNKLTFPGGLFFDRSHTWAFMEKDGSVRIGVDDFLVHVTGPVTRVDLKKPGSRVKKGEGMVKLIQYGKQIEIRSPLSGKVLLQNSALLEKSGLLNNAPYSDGWVYLVEPDNWLSEIRGYFMGEPYREWIRAEITRLKDFFSKGIALLMGGVPSPVIQDGGEVRYGILEEFGPEIWEEFQSRFINHAG